MGRQDGNRGGAGSAEQEINTNSPSGFSGGDGGPRRSAAAREEGDVCARAGGYGVCNGAGRSW